MSVLVNLLPDLRQAKQRDKRRRQIAIGVSVSVWVLCGAIVGVLALYEGGQKVLIANFSRSIGENTKKLKAVPDLETALTAQAHVAALPGLYGNRIYMTKFFDAYAESSPQDVALGSLTVDASNALTVNGSARNYAAVAKLARALEASNVTVGSVAAPQNSPYFTDVTITSTERSDSTGFITFVLKANLSSEVVRGSSN